MSLSEILYVSNLDTIIPLCEKAKTIAEKALNKSPKPTGSNRKALLKPLAGALNNIGYVYLIKGDVATALEYYSQVKELLEETKDEESLLSYYLSVGFIYMKQGNITKALDYFNESLKIAEKLNDKQSMAHSLTNIGYIYEHQDDYEKGLEYYKKSLILYKEIDNRQGIADCNNNMGVLYRNHSKTLAVNGSSKKKIKALKDKGINCLNKSLVIRKEIGDQEGIAACLNILGGIYQDDAEELFLTEGNSDSILKKQVLALSYYEKSLSIRQAINDKDGITYSLNSIAKILIKQNKLPQAAQYGQRSLLLAKEVGYPINIQNAAVLLSSIYEKQNKGMKALEMHKLFFKMHDSILSDETQKTTIKQQTKYEYEKKKVVDDAENDKLVAIEKKEKEKQTIISYATAVGLILVVVFLLFVFNRLKITRKQKKVIEEQNTEIVDSITYAKKIQDAILPNKKQVKKILPDSFIFYKPKDIVAGDFYWVEKIGDNILFAAADCTGHGVPGALVSVVCNNALNRVVREYNLFSPDKILDKTREIVTAQLSKSTNIGLTSMSNMRDGMDIALCSLNIKTNELQYAGAQNPLWILRNGADEIEEIKATKQSIGKIDTPSPYQLHKITLNKGDAIYLFSDGYADQFGGKRGGKFKYKPFKRLLVSIKNESMDKQLETLNNHFENWKGNLEQIDDVCVMGVKI